MTPSEANALFGHNMQQVNAMQPASGSMIKAVVRALEINDPATYIRLRDPEDHRVYYELVEGEQRQVERVAAVLGVTVTDAYLETWRG